MHGRVGCVQPTPSAKMKRKKKGGRIGLNAILKIILRGGGGGGGGGGGEGRKRKHCFFNGTKKNRRRISLVQINVRLS